MRVLPTVKLSSGNPRRADMPCEREDQRTSFADSPWIIFALIASIALTLALYASILREWIVDLETDPSYSFALLLPFVAIYLGYHNLHRQERFTVKPLIRPDIAGIFVVLGACALLLAADLTTIVFLSRLSFLIMIAGLTVVALGRSTMRSLAFPYGILFFCLPLPALVYLPLTFQLQLLSSVLATHLLHLGGVSVLREGNVLVLKNVSLEVVEACAGLHSLFALSALACIVSFLFVRSPVRSVLLVLSAIPIAIGLNAARISAAAIAANLWGPRAAEGFTHASIGVVTFAIGTLIILFVSGRLAVSARTSEPIKAVNPIQNSSRSAPGISVLAVIAVLLVVSAMHRQGLRTVRPEPLRESLASFPRDIDNWHGRDLSLTESQFESLGTRDVLMRQYSDGSQDEPVLLHVAFYPRQLQGSTMHSPLHCIPGSGWTVERRTLAPLYFGESDPPLEVNEVVFGRESDRILVLYWYLEQGAPQTSELKGAFQTMWDSATAGRSYGCLIRFSTPITTTTQSAVARASALVGVALPILSEQFLPAPDASKPASF